MGSDIEWNSEQNGGRVTANDPGNMKVLSNQPSPRDFGVAQVKSTWRSRGRDMLARLWPQTCFVCRSPSGRLAICAACERELPRLLYAGCPVCALPTPAGQTCGQCLRQPPHFDCTLVCHAYDSPVREMVLAFKFAASFSVRDVLVAGMLEAAAALEPEWPDCIVPMPLHGKRLAERGFNQSLELARELGLALGVPVLAQKVLRDIDTPHQTGLSVRQRRKNVRGAFRCTDSFSGKHVLVVDDVITSGASLDELARTLKLAGAARVTNVLAARTLREKDG